MNTSYFIYQCEFTIYPWWGVSYQAYPSSSFERRPGGFEQDCYDHHLVYDLLKIRQAMLLTWLPSVERSSPILDQPPSGHVINHFEGQIMEPGTRVWLCKRLLKNIFSSERSSVRTTAWKELKLMVHRALLRFSGMVFASMWDSRLKIVDLRSCAFKSSDNPTAGFSKWLHSLRTDRLNLSQDYTGQTPVP